VTRDLSRMSPIVGVLLAGGRSRRMGGGDKSLLSLHGAPLLQHVIDRLRPQANVLVLNANGDPARFGQFGLPVASDEIPGFAGPLAGLLAGMNWARKNRPQAHYLVTAPCDTPFFPLNLVAALSEAIINSGQKIAIAAHKGRAHPAFGLWSTELSHPLEAAIVAGRRKLLDWVDEHNGVSVEFAPLILDDAENDPFFNINTPDDLLTAEQILAVRYSP
jgi:molybdopterin-guanine dinucleotide biosynthesis protein A